MDASKKFNGYKLIIHNTVHSMNLSNDWPEYEILTIS